MRMPIAVGFYPGNKTEFDGTMETLLKTDTNVKNALGIISPHAGYAYSGSVAGKTYASAMTDKTNFILFGPNHSGEGSDIATSLEVWKTTAGNVETNHELINKLGIHVDEEAHTYEHSLEVQLPFLQTLYKNFKIVPICLKEADFHTLEKLAKKFDKNSFYIASSDFIHFGPNYEYTPATSDPLKFVGNIDKKLIDMICKLDAKGFYNEVANNNYTVCGAVPITLLMLVMKSIGAKKGLLIDYKTSYEVAPAESFVSYAGIVFV